MNTDAARRLEAARGFLGDTDEGLIGSEIGHLLQVSTPSPGMAKRHRVLDGFVASQNARQTASI